MLTPDGTLMGVAYAELKALCFVSENAQPDLFDLHPMFERRPKAAGLWVRFTFRDGAQLDGVLSHNLLEWPQHGYFATPPYASTNRQRMFIPRLALTQTDLRGVINAELRRKSEPPVERQLPMFD